MGLLVFIGRFVLTATAFLVVVAGAIIGASTHALSDSSPLFGAGLGALIGVLIAGSVFGALAALFQLARNTETILRVVSKADAKQASFHAKQHDMMLQLAGSSERTAEALEQVEARMRRQDVMHSSIS